MLNPDFDPLAILESMQEQLNQLLVDQQQLAKNCNYLYQTLVSHQKQLQALASLDKLVNTRLDLIKQELEERIEGFKTLNS
jgi:hypothetical protein